MKNPEQKIKVVAVNNNRIESKFDIYLERNGQRDWLMIHRHNGILYKMLEHGMRLDELRNTKGWRKDQVKYLLRVIDEFLEDEKSA